MMSSVSSTTPGRWENSWRTFSILTHVGAAPWIADRSARRYALPTVSAKPGSKAPMVELAVDAVLAWTTRDWWGAGAPA